MHHALNAEGSGYGPGPRPVPFELLLLSLSWACSARPTNVSAGRHLEICATEEIAQSPADLPERGGQLQTAQELAISLT